MNIQTELSIRGSSPPPPDSPNSSNHEPISPQQHQQQQQQSTRNACFKCQKPGHWARDCPEKSKSPFKPVTRCDQNAVGVPQLLCRCGAGPCTILVSHSAKNPNRMFYKCPAISEKNCGMFKWCDRVNIGEINNPRQYRFPECDCGSGTCQFVILQNGPNAGRECFVCPISKGQGACSFSRLFDHQRDIIINGEVQSEDVSSPVYKYNSDSDVEDEGDLGTKHIKKRDFYSPDNNNPQNTPSPVAISEPSKRPKSANSSPKPCDPLIEGFASNAGKSSLLTSHADIHCQQTEFRSLLSLTGPTSFDGVISNFNHIPLLNVADILEPEKLDGKLSSSPTKEPQISTGVLRDGSSELTDLIKEKISESYRQNALNIQNALLDQLERMDILDHEHMLNMASEVFESLTHLKVDYKTFHKRVMGFIRCASSLADIEWSICEEASSQQELADRHANEKDHFDSISRCEVEAMDTFTVSSDRLRSLQEEASNLKNRLAQVEKELLDCEKETKEHEDRLADISQEVSLSQQNIWEVEEASRLYEEREAEQRTAKAALDKARLQLRRY